MGSQSHSSSFLPIRFLYSVIISSAIERDINFSLSVNGAKEGTFPIVLIPPQGATYSLYDNAGGDFPLIDFTCTAPFTDEFIVIPLGYDGDYLSDFERLKELYITGRGRLKMLGILYGIFDRLSGEGHIPSVLTSAFNYISENISDSALKNREIAESIGVSECYLRRLFSENYGKSPRKYILEQRINLSCDMLCSQSVSVGEIADKCGFSSVYHFCRAFKERTGLTPTEYRKAYRNKGI